MSDATDATTLDAAEQPQADAHAHAPSGYGIYFRAWMVLLVITLAMVFLPHPVILVIGMMLKATIIASFFMHLKYETRDFIIMVAGCILFFSLVLFLLITPDGLAM